jgi:hypothetical protein
MLDFADRAAREAEVTERIALKHDDAAHVADSFEAGSFDLIVGHNILEFVDDRVHASAAPLAFCEVRLAYSLFWFAIKPARC